MLKRAVRGARPKVWSASLRKRHQQGLVLLGKGERVWDDYDNLGCSSFCDPHISTSNSCRAELEALAVSCLTQTSIWVTWQETCPGSVQIDHLLSKAWVMQKGWKKWKQLVGCETKRKLSGWGWWDRLARSKANGKWFQWSKSHPYRLRHTDAHLWCSSPAPFQAHGKNEAGKRTWN